MAENFAKKNFDVYDIAYVIFFALRSGGYVDNNTEIIPIIVNILEDKLEQ